MAEHQDLRGSDLNVGDSVVFCLAGSCHRMQIGTVVRVLPKTVEVSFQKAPGAGLSYRFRSPEDVVRV